MSLTTTTKVKTYLGISGTTYDTLIDSLVKSVSSSIERYCKRKFERDTYTEYFDTDGEKYLFLDNFPVASITSIQYSNGVWSNITWLDVNDDDYLLSENGKIAFAYHLPSREKYLKIVYLGGFLVDFANETDDTKHTLPFDLTQIATEMVAQTYNLRTTGGVQSESTEGQSITYKNDSDVLKAYSSRLDAYRSIKI